MTYSEKIVNVQTGEEVIRPYTQEEIEAVKTEEARMQAELNKQQEETAAKDAAKQAVLDKLGLSADEVAALLG